MTIRQLLEMTNGVAGAIAFVSPGEFTVTDSEFTDNEGINAHF
jgi:hypothetical protein